MDIMMDRFKKSLKYTKSKLAIVNVLGLAFFVYSGSRLWAPIGREGFDYFDEVTGLLWGWAVLPPLAVCMLINIVVMRKVLVAAFYYQEWVLLLLWIAIVSIWFFAVKYDLSRHYNGSQLPPRESMLAPSL